MFIDLQVVPKGNYQIASTPRWVSLNTNALYSQITTAGFLNKANNSQEVQRGDFIAAFYASGASASKINSIFTAFIDASGVITLFPLTINEATYMFVDGLVTYQADIAAVGIYPGSCRDSTNSYFMQLNSSVRIDYNVSGANGLDTGAIAASTWYAVFVISDSTNTNPIAGLISLSQTAPTLPEGYDIFRRIGWTLTDNISQVTRLWQSGNGLVRTYYYDNDLPVLSGGTATSYATVNIGAGIPPITPKPLGVATGRGEGYFNLTYTTASAANKVQFGIPSGATDAIVTRSNGAAQTAISPLWLPITLGASPSIAYQTTSASDSVSLSVAAFKDYL